MLLVVGVRTCAGRRLVRPRLSTDHRWVVVGVLSLTVTVSYGVLMYAFPVVLPAMQAEFGWETHVLTGAWSLGVLVSGVAAVAVGRWIDQHGPRGVMTGCAAAAAALVVGWSRVESAALLYVLWVGLGACSAGLFYEPAFATIAQRFRSERVQAIAAVTTAGGLASTIFVPVTAVLTQHLGWRGAVSCLAGVLAMLAAVVHVLLPRRPSIRSHYDGVAADAMRAAARPQRPAVRLPRDDARRLSAGIRPGETMRSRSFRRLILASSISTLASTAFLVHLIPILVASGHDLAVASLALAGTGLTKLTGRVLLVPLARRAGSTGAAVIVHAMQALGVLVLSATSSLAGVVACILLFGMGDGASTVARAELVTEFSGTTGYGTASGVLALFLSVARAAGPIAASLVLAATGAYDATLAALVVALLLAAALVRFAGAAAHRGKARGCVLLPNPASTLHEQDIAPDAEGDRYDRGTSHNR